MSQNNAAYSTKKEDPPKEGTKKPKVRGPNFTAPHLLRTPKGSSHLSWEQSIDAQMSYIDAVKAEAKKASTVNNYVPRIKITKRFKQFFDEEVIDARRRAKFKKKRSNNVKKD